VLYTLPATHALSLSNPPTGTVYYAFGGSGQPDVVQVPFTITIPPGLDLTAGNSLTFDMVYVCSAAGSLSGRPFPTTLADAITIRVDVVSALQASYAGPAFDFGEVGDLTDSEAQSLRITGAIRVASTGPYTVALSSENDYRMTYPGGNPANGSQSLKYSARFLGQTRNSTWPVFSTVICARAGTAGQNLPIAVTLQEGGEDKVPAPDYADTLTITVTPLAVPYGGFAWPCPLLQ
jgi:spore coat protein U-like protein